MKRIVLFFYLPMALGILSLSRVSGEQPPVKRPQADETRGTYVLGPDDQITIHAIDPEETTDKPVRIDMNGYIRLPMVGRLKASGLTVEQLEQALDESLKPYLVAPDVSVFITEFHSQPVSVMGAVKNPGIIQLQGHKTLSEVLSLAGGLTEDSGRSVKITRLVEEGPIPLPNAASDSTGGFYVAEVSLKDLMEAKNPAENIVIRPQDVISVPRGEMIYVVGQVLHAGGFVLKERQSLSVLQALAVAGGFDKTAAAQKARILRPIPGETTPKVIPVDLKKISEGRSEDLAMRSDDILYIPSNKSKAAFTKGVETILSIATGVAIYRL